MNTSSLRKYAPQARRDFLRAVTDRAAKVGLRENGDHVSIQASGEAAIMGGQSYPRAFKEQRDALANKVADTGFDTVMEEAAYVWFNRLMALRYMEVHGYLDHGFCVFSHPHGGPRPELLEKAAEANLPGLGRQVAVAMLIDGGKDEELYRTLLLAQCRALHQSMPFLFEPVDDATELLLPDNLLASGSVVRKLVAEIPEEDWKSSVEIVGWLYQFYISEEKARVDAAVKKRKAVKPSEIPAKTQIFTPNWIVKYMVQNSLGRLWLDIEPSSSLKASWEYWIEPAAQEPEVEAELTRLATETRAKHPTPETITFIDPCAGSGHILAEAYDTLKGIYQERGYPRREIPRLILERNLYGLEIDARAAQMAGFALLMKARGDDRTILTNPPRLNVVALKPNGHLEADEVLDALLPHEVPGFSPTLLAPMLDGQSSLGDATTASQVLREAVCSLIDLFKDAATLGSLIRVPPKLAAALPVLRARLAEASSDLLSGQTLAFFAELVRHAELLALRADVAVTNPPYLEVSRVGDPLKSFVDKHYPAGKPDLYGCFMERCCQFAVGGYSALINIPNWMFLSSFEKLREGITTRQTIDNLAHLGRGVFGSDFGTVAFVIRDRALPTYKGSFKRLFFKQGAVASLEEIRRRFFNVETHVVTDEQFREIPGAPIAYWVSENVRRLFRTGTPLKNIVTARQGAATGDNEKYIRFWWEVDRDTIGEKFSNQEAVTLSGKRWVPLNKGGPFRKWYGNLESVIRFDENAVSQLSLIGNKLPSRRFYFLPSGTWSDVTSGPSSFRACPPGCVFGNVGHSFFGDEIARGVILAYANTPIVGQMIPQLCPTVHFDKGYFEKLPFPGHVEDFADLVSVTDELVSIAVADWDDRESSRGFLRHPLLRHKASRLIDSFGAWYSESQARISRTLELETNVNQRFIQASGLDDELDPVSSDASCGWLRPTRELLLKTFVSYSVGVLMGRWEHGQGTADDDGILPVTEDDWFGTDDTAARISDFADRVWFEGGVTDNVKLLADGLGIGPDAAPLDSIRRYLASGFYKDHLQTYRKKPIYWLFSSGTERAFQALVYLHRYDVGTLSRMRMNYVIPLQQRMNVRIEQVSADIEASTTTIERRRREKEFDDLRRQAVELKAYDEKLRHYADQRIELDLDDGVRANYAKFGDLLAESAKIVGDKENE
jgi:hypothetical protein